MGNGAAHGNGHGNAKISHVGGRHLSPPPHPDTENDGVEVIGDDSEEEEDDDDDDIYTDDVHQTLGDHVHPVAAGTETQTVPAVSTGGGPAGEPSAADIHPQGEQEGYERGVVDKNHDALQKEPTRDVSRDDTGVGANASSGGGVLANGSTEEVHAA